MNSQIHVAYSCAIVCLSLIIVHHSNCFMWKEQPFGPCLGELRSKHGRSPDLFDEYLLKLGDNGLDKAGKVIVHNHRSGLTLSQTSSVFTCLQYKAFENTVGKGEIARNEQFLIFPQCFLPV